MSRQPGTSAHHLALLTWLMSPGHPFTSLPSLLEVRRPERHQDHSSHLPRPRFPGSHHAHPSSSASGLAAVSCRSRKEPELLLALGGAPSRASSAHRVGACVPPSARFCRDPFTGQTPVESDCCPASQPNLPPHLYMSKRMQDKDRIPPVARLRAAVTAENLGAKQLGISGTQLVKRPSNNVGTRGEWSYYVDQTKSKQAMV